jgi:hypothetical protein
MPLRLPQRRNVPNQPALSSGPLQWWPDYASNLYQPHFLFSPKHYVARSLMIGRERVVLANFKSVLLLGI